ncbi:MAG: GntR family transcriptional regulator [Acidobacteria bacterium]|nr:GntR family transcriptional regulator [Acidobacteriota bacterium]
MLIHVEHHSGVPVYRQIIDQVVFHIASGILKVGDELPSVRHLSKQLQVNPMTISKAFSFLEHDGFVERRPGRPLLVSEQHAANEIAKKLTLVREDLKNTVVKAQQLSIDKQALKHLMDEIWQEVDS